jgi:hypothetical protein
LELLHRLPYAVDLGVKITFQIQLLLVHRGLGSFFHDHLIIPSYNLVIVFELLPERIILLLELLNICVQNLLVQGYLLPCRQASTVVIQFFEVRFVSVRDGAAALKVVKSLSIVLNFLGIQFCFGSQGFYEFGEVCLSIVAVSFLCLLVVEILYGEFQPVDFLHHVLLQDHSANARFQLGQIFADKPLEILHFFLFSIVIKLCLHLFLLSNSGDHG